jgi:methyl-galactoside transport system ATP-binding protein
MFSACTCLVYFGVMMTESNHVLEMLGVTKQFPGVLALNNVDFQIKPGTVHALMGENGAGKSTLMKCLFGIYKMDAGKIILKGRECHFNSTADAMAAGVSMIHQELSNVPERSVAQNLWLGREPLNKWHLINHKKMLGDTKSCFRVSVITLIPVSECRVFPLASSRAVRLPGQCPTMPPS